MQPDCAEATRHIELSLDLTKCGRDFTIAARQLQRVDPFFLRISPRNSDYAITVSHSFDSTMSTLVDAGQKLAVASLSFLLVCPEV